MIPKLPNFRKDSKKSEKSIATKFKTVKKLGTGAFGDVYEIERLTDHEHLAYKVVKIEKIDEASVKEVKMEGKILRKLNHPCIIKFIECHINIKSKEFYVITELAKNGDLSQMIENHKNKQLKFDENQIIDWLTQISMALIHIHNKKVIHRDLKPNNLFLSSHNIIKLGDFGVSKNLFFTNQLAGTIVGTPLYMAPEIVDGKKYQYKVDMWSLGVIIYELMALVNPFDSRSIPATYNKILSATYEKLPDCYSNELRELVYSLLQVDPDKRPSANQILEKKFIIERANKRLTEIQFNPNASQSFIMVYVSKIIIRNIFFL